MGGELVGITQVVGNEQDTGQVKVPEVGCVRVSWSRAHFVVNSAGDISNTSAVKR